MILAWGKPQLFIRKVTKAGGGDWITVPTPIEGTTELATTKGDKVEAKIEGGENEAVKYNRSTYACNFNIRSGAEDDGTVRKKPVADDDGVISGNYEFLLAPEDLAAPGFYFAASTLSVEDAFSVAEGASWNYTADALKSGDKKQIVWGTITLTEGKPTKLKPIDDSDEITF